MSYMIYKTQILLLSNIDCCLGANSSMIITPILFKKNNSYFVMIPIGIPNSTIVNTFFVFIYCFWYTFLHIFQSIFLDNSCCLVFIVCQLVLVCFHSHFTFNSLTIYEIMTMILIQKYVLVHFGLLTITKLQTGQITKSIFAHTF